jgi:hypothetical protein
VTADEALRRIQGTSETPFDPRRTALLEGNDPGLKTPEADGSFSGTAKVTRRPTNGLIAETSSDRPAVLVVSEINYPGWIAWVDGQRAPIITADYLLRSVVVPAGLHRVEMRYTAPAARLGARISLIAIGLIIALPLIAFRSQRASYRKLSQGRSG